MASAASHAAVVCVDPDKPACQATVQDGVNAANGGDTVSIAKGVFNESVVVPAGKNGLVLRGKKSVIDSATLGSGIVVMSAGVQITGVVVRNASNNGIEVQAGADGVEISKVTVQNANGDCVDANGNGMVLENSLLIACGSYAVDGTANDVVIRNNTIKHADSGGISLNSTSNNAVIERNRISIIEDGDCISVSGNDAEVVGNTMANCDDAGLELDGDAPFVVKNRVTGAAGFDIGCTADCNGEISGNRVADTGEDEGGFEIDAAVAGLIVTKNRVERSNDEGFYITGNGSMTLTSNLVRDAGGDNYEPCYEIYGTGHRLEKNTCDSTPDDGIYVSDGDGHVLEGNKIANAMEDGIDVNGGVTNITISRNRVVAGASGIEVGAGTTGSVTDNSAKGGRVDFCDESAGGVSSAGNKFDTTAGPTCQSDVD